MKPQTMTSKAGEQFTVTTLKVQLMPPAFRLEATHSSGVIKDVHTWTHGDADVSRATQPGELQAALNNARAELVERAQRKYELHQQAEQLV